jgi:hypothetical protein
LYNVAMGAVKQGFISQETGWDLVGIEDKVKERERLDRQLQQATPEELQQGWLSDPDAQHVTAEQQAQMQQQEAQPNVGDATTAAMSEGLPYEQNPQAANPVVDQMNALQNMISNPRGG